MLKKMLKPCILLLALTVFAVGCSTQQPAQTPAPTATPGAPSNADLNNRIDSVIKDGVYRFGPGMRGVSDSFDNMYFAAKGGNWALANYMGDVMGDYMEPSKISSPKNYPAWDSFQNTYLGDDSALRKAINSKNMSAFETAYNDTMNKGCNPCHSGLGFRFIKKVKAASPEANLDYTVKSEPGENK